MVVHGFQSLEFIDDETEDRSRQVRSGGYGDILSALIQSSVAELIGQCMQTPDLDQTKHAFHLLKTKFMAEKPTNKLSE